MQMRRIGAEMLGLGLTIATCWACSGSDAVSPGDTPSGGASAGGVASTGTNTSGLSTVTGGSSGLGGAVTTGGASAKTGSTVQGGKGATGGAASSGSTAVTGGMASTGGGPPATGGTKADVGGGNSTGGVTKAGTGGKSSAVGGTKAGTGEQSSGVGGTVGNGGKNSGNGGTTLLTGGAGAVGGKSSASGGSGTGGASSHACSGPGKLSPGNTTISLTVGGNTYPMVVHAPPGYDGSERLPVVFDFHGLGGDETQMQFISGWAGTGDTEGFITDFPGGVDDAWNAGFCCSDTTTDVDFVKQAIETLNNQACIDPGRVYASGCSNGGGMSYRLACEAADVIAAIAPVDFDCAVGFSCRDCSPSRPITVVQFRATEDSAVPYTGAQPNFERWGVLNECTGSPAPLAQNSSCQAFPACAEDVQTILCTVQDGTHCGNYWSFGIAALAWPIISQYSLP